MKHTSAILRITSQLVLPMAAIVLVLSAMNGRAADTDSDTLPDDWELAKFGSLYYGTNDDPDGDTLDNSSEYYFGSHPWIADTDSDSLGDSIEYWYSFNPNSSDSDSDGLTDGDEYFNHGTNPGSPDTDSDGINDYDELNVWSSNPLWADTDTDYMPDGWELLYFGTPTAADPGLDEDGDQTSNLNEYAYSTNPLDPLSHP